MNRLEDDLNDIHVIDILEAWLKQNDYDGLYNESNGCACRKGNLVPCEERIADCIAGYEVIPPEDVNAECDFYICSTPHDTPWEDEV
jgi:hypothetical protein